jgi:tRNA dimethylallyltransferase
LQNESIPLNLEEFAIVGGTASGKSALAFKIAKERNFHILSIDSLSIYKYFDIVSAKPTKNELKEVRHFGIDEILPTEKFDAQIFSKLYLKAKEEAKKDKKGLIIVGGTSFYLKSLLQGLSFVPEISEETISKRDYLMQNLEEAYNFLSENDPEFCENISQTDSYRIEKGLDILIQTEIPPSIWFKKNPPRPIIKNHLHIFNLQIERKLLRERIRERTVKMVENGLIDEVQNLSKIFDTNLNPFKAIGVKETLQFLKGEINSKNELIDLISIHTGQLAKRQETFNRTQFKDFNIKEI